MKLKTKRRRKRREKSPPSEPSISSPAAKAEVKALLEKRQKRTYELPPIIEGECPMCGEYTVLNVLYRPLQICGKCGFLPDKKFRAILMAKGWWPPSRYKEGTR